MNYFNSKKKINLITFGFLLYSSSSKCVHMFNAIKFKKIIKYSVNVKIHFPKI